MILEKKKGSVRSSDVAEQMNVKKPSVSNAIKLLKEGGFLTMDGDKLLHLTELGREVAETIYERHCILTEGLIYLGVDPEIAEQDACLLEHDISSESLTTLIRILNILAHQLRLLPHGRSTGVNAITLSAMETARLSLHTMMTILARRRSVSRCRQAEERHSLARRQ